MFGFIAVQIPAMALHAIELAKHDQKMFELSIADLSNEQKKEAREKRRTEQTEERRHRELCQAIRDSKRNTVDPGTAFLGGLFIGSMFD